jgi:uncharacterized RDD family membrane protein YckC
MSTQASVTPETVCAGVLVRFVANFIDGLILIIPNLILRLVLPGALGLVSASVLGAVYTVYFWTNGGSTPGKKAMGLQVVLADGGGVLDVATALVRYVGYFISALPFFLGFLWAIWDPRHETWHDKIAKTKVIKTR